MAIERRHFTCAPILLAATLLTWPAFWNRYPIVFADTGTYLSQAIELSPGWDRPVFYSLFMLQLHLTLTTWPVVAAQALLTAHTLHLVRRTLLPNAACWWLLPVAAVLSIGTALPWLVSQLTPDLFTPLLVLVVALLVLAPDRCSQVELSWLALFAAFMIAVHLSNVPLVSGLLLVLLPLRLQLGAVAPLGRRGLLFALAPPMLAMLALVSVNLAAFGRVSLSPFGNVFLLARVIYDGPGMDALQRDCARADWLLCRQLNHFPPSADEFLWRADGPVILAGGAKRVSTEANAIIDAALIAEPVRQARAFAANSLQQLSSFASGSGLGAWPHTVTPILERHFPIAERAAYAEARQTGEALAVPAWLQTIHIATALVGVAGCSALALRVRRQRVGGLAIAVLLALLCNAAITGGLSGPHDRYQSRVMWLPPLITLLGLPLIARPSQ